MPARSRFCPVRVPQTESDARSFWLYDDLSGTSDKTSSSSGNKSDLMTTRCVSSNGRRMPNGVHGNTSDSRPMRSLGLHLEVHSVGFKERFVGSLTTSSDTIIALQSPLICFLFPDGN